MDTKLNKRNLIRISKFVFRKANNQRKIQF